MQPNTLFDLSGNERLPLRCQKCGKVGTYNVGVLLLSPSAQAGDWIGFTGRVRCRGCDASDAWDLPSTILDRIENLLRSRALGRKVPLAIGEMRAFDGRAIRYGGQYEDYLRSLVQASPEDYYPWSRLGNFYVQHNDSKLAAAAFENAIALNPADIESQHSLALLALKRRKSTTATGHFHLVLEHARNAQRTRPDLLRNLVEHSLEQLIELNARSGGRIPIIPPSAALPGTVDTSGTVTIHVQTIDLSDHRVWNRLIDYHLGLGPSPFLHERRVERAESTDPPSQQTVSAKPLKKAARRCSIPWEGELPQRYAPCPCGSGRKFKRCCLSRMVVEARVSEKRA